MGLLKRDWSSVISNWPLEDWSTAVALLVNYVWVSDSALFRRFCGVLINRLLDPLSECSLTAEEQGAAAWACSVISTDLNGMVRAWCRLCDVKGTEQRGETLLVRNYSVLLISNTCVCMRSLWRGGVTKPESV
ncbi:unnamed protein product [Echinostoma caproni]|uniref:Pecanex-like protein n=1 Tax=Echinostoma caproni TaxID=27848 RepID=A0A183A355_9TREM|nr:unnamed protein product [Echinostoma caproni]